MTLEIHMPKKRGERNKRQVQKDELLLFRDVQLVFHGFNFNLQI